MADVVQYPPERMVNELEDLEKRGIFTRVEIAEIVKQRRKFEYRLKRPSPLKEDFIAYIDYETQLDQLRRLRKKAVAHEAKKKMKKSVSDFSGVARIVEIYRLATMKYKGDINLWFRYLEFCRQKKNGRMKKVLAQVIRFHPKVPGVWIYAAAWEFDQNLNVAAARALMQNGLRVCPHSEDLWVEYLRMELTYLNKLKARKLALGEVKGNLLGDKKSAEDGKETGEINDEFLPIVVEEGSNVEDDDTSEKVDVFQEKGSDVLQTIYSGAVEALPSSFSLRQRFLEILDGTDLARSEEIRNPILSDMKRDFCREPGYWDWLARYEMSDSISRGTSKGIVNSQLQKAIQVYEEGIRTATSSAMFDMFIKFLMEIIAPSNSDDNQISPSSNHTSDCVSHLISVYQKADATGCLTEDLACKYVSFYLQLERTQEAQKLSEKLCSGRFMGSAKLWLSRISIKMRSLSKDSTSPSNEDSQSIFDLLSNALKKVPISESESLWQMALKFFANQRNYLDKLIEMSVILVTKGGGGDHGFSPASMVVNFILQTRGIQSAREAYKRFLALPHPGLVLYRVCIEIESNLASLGDKDCLRNARKLYDSAVATYSQDAKLWQDYYSMETKLGTSETANAVHWRARKTLKDSAGFIVPPDLL
ncbi:PREDICTED: U3 small nucleolar RNA-associated protein 6 homolog [Tarenaya hassleriana]|uniref:U3 small nucleolar RNA-associated protein 6 homolog n=1 Tax=Tarenaya hassleriana TaxID=28532 RepID=UPI00053C5052|nr:PREDICTED: U3 small nucleolar RNA-associated protein 6 homolog [Tarenaya hassleriana]